MKIGTLGLVAGVGSLPYSDPKPALDLIWKNVPQIPHWPQLPMAGADEGFSIQYLQALAALGMVSSDEGLMLKSNDPEWLVHVTSFYELYLAAQDGDLAALDKFAFPHDAARGFYAFTEDLAVKGTRDALYIKGQLSGPLTVGFQLKSPDKKSSYYDPQFRDIVVKNLAMHGIWQVRKLKEYGLPVIMTVDDPSLYAYGISTHITLKREEIIEDLNTIYGAIKSEGAWTGTHVCAGMDWTILFDSIVDIINFDAYEYFDSIKVYPEQLKDFLSRGGVLAWGIVPTSPKILTETPETLAERLDLYLQELETRGLPRKLVLEQSMFTPSCGTGTLGAEMAGRVYTTLNSLGDLVKKLV